MKVCLWEPKIQDNLNDQENVTSSTANNSDGINKIVVWHFQQKGKTPSSFHENFQNLHKLQKNIVPMAMDE